METVTEQPTLIDLQKIRSDFPILDKEINGKPLVYFDNGATAQKPKIVIEAINHYYSEMNANIHRGVHQLSQEATSEYENSRKLVQEFINAPLLEEVIFTKGTTDSINLVAHSFSKAFINEGDIVIVSEMEHHSNIVPWQMVCEERGAELKVIPMDDNGDLIVEEYEKLLSPKVRLVSVAHVSNTLGTINPVKHIIEKAHEVGAKVLLDGAQAVPHMAVDVQELNCDFYAFSGHKMFGPTGVGILYGKKEILDAMPPYQGGGDMIKTVSFEKTIYNELPHKFEAGTPNIEGGLVLGKAIEYINSIGYDAIGKHEEELLEYATSQMLEIDGMRIIGTAKKKASVISFVVDNVHPYDVGTLLDKMGIAVRTGHHCTDPIMNHFKIPGTIRASFAMYNTKEEVDIFIKALNRVLNMLR